MNDIFDGRFLAVGLLMIALTAAPLATSVGAQPDQATENWPNFRGPNGNGVAPETARPPVQFGPQQNLKWRVAIPGQGHSSPIVWNDRIYLMSAVNTQSADKKVEDSAAEEAPGGRRRGIAGMNHAVPTTEYQFNVLCLDRSNGQILWNKEVTRGIPHEGGHRSNTYASASPVTDGQHLWCNFGSQGVWCLDLEGNVIWSRDLGKMVTRNQFGEGASVAVRGNVLVIPWDQEQNSFILAVDAFTGQDLWKKDREEVTSWATPVIVEQFGKQQVITNGTTIRSYDLQSGDLIWQCRGQTTNPIATPLIWQDTAICMTGHRGFSIQAIALAAQGDVTDQDAVKWKRDDSAPYIASPTLVDGVAYFVKGNTGILSSIKLVDGSPVIQQVRLPGIDQMYASLITARGNVYACGRNGNIIVFRHAQEFQELHRIELGEPVDATPAVSGNLLLIRGHQHLYCFEG